MDFYDVAIVGAGPAGSTCAASCARNGLRTLLLERENFPREKVCGDCLNPSCWPVLERLGVADSVRALAHGRLDFVDFIGIGGRSISVPLPAGPRAEIAVKRSAFDAALLAHARELGAEIRESATVTSVVRPAQEGNAPWIIEAGGESFSARFVVAADGRNSTVARLCDLLPRAGRERVALQTHVPLPAGFGDRVVLQLLPQGYSGQARVGDGQLNVCLVSKPSDLPATKRWAEEEFSIPCEHPWRTITPLTRDPLPAAHAGLYLVGDAARVVEPFTGEGIFYALRSGELAATAMVQSVREGNAQAALREYIGAHRAMYRGRGWVNRLARAAVLNPRVTSAALELLRFRPELLRYLTGKIVT